MVTCLFAAVMTSSASVTVQGWWHFGEVSDLYGDSSGNGRRFGSAFSSGTSGNAGVGVEPFGAGGPLGTSGFTSTNCLYWTPAHKAAAGMWGIGYNPPAANYVLECWCWPEYPGTKPGDGSWLFCSGSGGGVKFHLTNDNSGNMFINAMIIGTAGTGGGDIIIGNPWPVDTNHWTHLAIVNDSGNCTFFVNGVTNGPTEIGDALNSVPAGDVYAGSHPGTQPTYTGYLDELRMSTFAPGAFSTTDLLMRAQSPNILVQPASASVWAGGAAPFTVGVAFDDSTTYQWRRGGVAIPGANASEYSLGTTTLADSGAQFDCILNNYTGTAVTSKVATLTVVPVNSANTAAYENAVKAESSLLAYYPVDSNSGGTLTDVKGGATGSLEGTAEFDGRTNRAFGVRSVLLHNDASGDVFVSNPAFEFASGNGTIEAIVFLGQAISTANETIFADANDGASSVFYSIQASPDGTSLIYNNDTLTQPVSWGVPNSLLGRQAHVAVVFSYGTVTAYVDGLSLGTQPNATFGNSSGGIAYIGSLSLDNPAGGVWTGNIDELAIYNSALSANTIAIHNSKFLFGTNTSAPTFSSYPTGSKSLLAGGRAVFSATASGTAPLSYQWTFNGAPLSGATAATLVLPVSTVAQSGNYAVTVSNPYGATNSPAFNVTFATPPDAYTALVMADNPMAFWRLDETNGTTAFDAAGAHDGAYSGSMTRGAGGALPKVADFCVHFTGGGVQVPYTPVLNPNGAFSVEFWANPDTTSTYVPMASQYRAGSARDGWAFYDYNDGNSWELQLGNANGVSHYAYNGPPAPQAGTWYQVCMVWDGTNTLSLYSENNLVGRNTTVANGGTYVPNSVNPLVIGQRNDGNFAFHGLMADVAVYNYALTQTQISNHWSIKFQPPAITTAPVGVTNVEGSTITLSVTAVGFPNTYQWLANGAPLSDAGNYDGSAHYSSDVTNATLVITQAKPADSGLYQVQIANALGQVTSVNVNVLVVPDTNKPVVVAVTGLGTPNLNASSGGPYLVKVLFNKRMEPNGAGTAANYSLNPPVSIVNVAVASDVLTKSLGGDWRAVYLQTAGLTPGQKYALTVSGIQDQATTPNTIAASTTYFRAPLLTSGAVAWDYYYLDSASTTAGVAPLTGSTIYPNAPETNAYFTTFDSSAITGGDVNNNAAFGSLGDNYGDAVSGWITPAVSGAYTFFIASDDASELDLSTDATPGNLQTIAYDNGCCHGFTEPTNSPAPTYTSAPINLVAGQHYFIRALHIEGGGGDYVKVAWRISTDTTPASQLTPIPGLYLSSYQPVPAPYFGVPTVSGGSFRLPWIGYQATVLQSTDLKTWTPVAGNPNPIVVPVNNSTHTFYRLVE